MVERKTYIINIDGMRADYFGATGNHQKCLTPALVSLAKKGIRFTRCKDILPAVTSANHTAILTSTNVGTHGICGAWYHYKGLDFAHLRVSPQHGTARMDYYKHRHLQGLPTFFNVVKMNNPSSFTALVIGKHWVGEVLNDEDCDVLIYAGNPSNPDYVTPSPGFVLGGKRHEGDTRIPPRLYIPKKGDRFVRPPRGTWRLPFEQANANLIPSDKWIIDQTIQTICHYDPDFMYIILNNMDSAGHAYGSFSDTNISNINEFINPDAMMDQLFITDSEIKRFIDFLKRKHSFENSRIIITSDHGMSSMKEAKEACDVRKILAMNGIKIRANTRWRPFGYNDVGEYEWCFTDGNTVYIYCRGDVEKDIKKALERDIKHVHEIFDKNDQIKRGMWKGSYEDVVWPRLIMFLEPNYFNMGYGDTIAVSSGASIQLQPHFQFLIAKAYGLPFAIGTHGGPSEQDVPLIFVSPDEPEVPNGVTNDDNVSVLDILPTINALNRWPEQPTFEGAPLISTTDKQRNRKRNRLPKKGIR